MLDKPWRLVTTAVLIAHVVAPHVLLGQGTPGLAAPPIPPTVPGGVRVLTVVAEASTVTARVLDQTVRLHREPDGPWRAVVGIDLATAPGTYPVVVTARSQDGTSAAARTSMVVGVRQFPTRMLKVAPQFTDPSPRDLVRIRAEAARLAALYDDTSVRAWRGGFRAPVPGLATSSFGSRSIFNGQPRAPHTGTDFRGAVGTPVVTPGAGRIVLAEDLFMTGHTVVVDHGDSLFSVLAHLSTIEVATGQLVPSGTRVGRVGATGRVTGPHLHWSVRLAGARVDPLLLLEALPAPRAAPPQTRVPKVADSQR